MRSALSTGATRRITSTVGAHSVSHAQHVIGTEPSVIAPITAWELHSDTTTVSFRAKHWTDSTLERR